MPPSRLPIAAPACTVWAGAAFAPFHILPRLGRLEPCMSDALLTILNRHTVERAALLARFEVECRNPTVPIFLRPKREDRLELHGGCSIITDTPFTVLFCDSRGFPCSHLIKDAAGRLGMNFLGREPRVIALSPEGAVKLWKWGSERLEACKSDMECQVWSTDAAELFFHLHAVQMAEVMPLLEEEEMANGNAVEAN